MRTLSWLAALLFAAPALAAASVVPRADPIPPESTESSESLAFDADKSLRMTVPVSIDGKGPFAFVVDTGAERTVLSEELAGTLGLGSTGTVDVHSISGIQRFNTVRVPSLSVTSTPVRNVTAPLIKHRDLGAAGLLGIDSLQSKTVLIDFIRQTLTVSQAPPGPISRADEDDTIVVRARNRLGRLILADASVDGRKIAIVVDTGAEYSVGNPSLHRQVSRRRGNTFVVPTNLHSVTGGVVPADIMLVDDLRIGNLTLTRMPIAFADLEVFRQLGLDKRPAMLLGMNTLRAFEQVAVDFANKKVRFVVPGESGRSDGTRLASAALR